MGAHRAWRQDSAFGEDLAGPSVPPPPPVDAVRIRWTASGRADPLLGIGPRDRVAPDVDAMRTAKEMTA